MTEIKIKCGRCATEFSTEIQKENGKDAKISCILCGYSKENVKESDLRSNKKVILG